MTTPINQTAVKLAIEPTVGTPFEFGGKAFNLQYLTIAGEEALIRLAQPQLVPLVIAGKRDNESVFHALRPVLPQALAIILRDYDPTVTEEWVLGQRGPHISKQMFDIVAAQFEVSDLGKLLSGHLLTDAYMRLLDAARKMGRDTNAPST